MKHFLMPIVCAVPAVALFACGGDDDDATPTEKPDFHDAPEMVASGGNQNLEADYAGKYRDDLENHIGCTPRDAYDNQAGPLTQSNDLDPIPGSPAVISGFPCAAKEYTNDAVDSTKPIVILVHGNSDSPDTWEDFRLASLDGAEITTLSGYSFYSDLEPREALASKLVNAGYRTIAIDFRVDKVGELDDYSTSGTYANPSLNIDHGWAVPIMQSLIKAVMLENPSREVSLIGHSLGVTVIRDALRRLFVEYVDGVEGAINPFPQVQDVILLHGANHGVSTYEFSCGSNSSMAGKVTCQMGSRTAYKQTYFHKPLNGELDVWSTPCGDGSTAFGQEGVCDDHVVEYTTLTIEDDTSGGMLRDEFVSEASAMLNSEYCDNLTVAALSFDSSGYFFDGFNGLLANHLAAPRSDEGMNTILDVLGD